jgi:hypothetical protein
MRRILILSVAGVLASVALGGCGELRSGTTKTVVQTVTAPSADAPRAASHHRHASRRPSSRAAPAAHSARSTAGDYVYCDPNIAVKVSTTSCGFAENVFYEYWTSDRAAAVDAYSPAVATTVVATCAATGGSITCRTARDAVVRFSVASLEAYDQRQADHYAATHDLGPDGGYSDPAVPPADQGPTPDNEIPNYPNGTGSVVQCVDGMYSHSGGRPGACSYHGGVAG